MLQRLEGETEQAYIERLETSVTQLSQKLAATKTSKQKPVELLIEHETGFVQIRRLTPQAINLPTWVINWLFDNVQELMTFMKNNSSLLASKEDDETTQSLKFAKRNDNLSADNPIVRKPRAENKPKYDGEKILEAAKSIGNYSSDALHAPETVTQTA